jgi:hypothetical protein
MANVLNKLNSASYITVKVTDDPITNGNNLLAAYALAKLYVTPSSSSSSSRRSSSSSSSIRSSSSGISSSSSLNQNLSGASIFMNRNVLQIQTQNQSIIQNINGQPLSAYNRLSVILPPAIYDLGAQSLILDADYIDIVGSTSNRESHYIKSNIGIANRGTLQLKANNVKLFNLKIENTNTTYQFPIGTQMVWRDGPNGYDEYEDNYTIYSNSDPAAYFPDNAKAPHIENVLFKSNASTIRSTRTHIDYAGTYINCEAGEYSFGAYGRIIAGSIFKNCNGGNYSFAMNGQTMLGCVFENCTAGECSFAGNGTCNGKFYNCIAKSQSFGGRGSTNAEFYNCTAEHNSFGTYSSGIYHNCNAGARSFGGYDDLGFNRGHSDGTYVNCTASWGSFGSNYSYGNYRNCKAKGGSFGGEISAGNYYNCVAEDSSYGGGGTESTSSGVYINCVGGDYSFGSNPSDPGDARSIGVYKNCVGGIGSFNVV